MLPLATIGNVLSFTDTTVPAGATVGYAVAAISTVTEGPRTATVLAQRANVPSPPTAPTAAVVKNGITVTWKVPANGGSAITGYRVYRGTASGAETFLVTVSASTMSYTDASVGRKTRYYYRVTATNVIGEGSPSVEVNATTR